MSPIAAETTEVVSRESEQIASDPTQATAPIDGSSIPDGVRLLL